MANNKITEESLIDKNVYKIGQKLAEGLDKGSDAVKHLNKDLKAFGKNLEEIKRITFEYDKLSKAFKVAPTRVQFMKLKKEELKLNEQNNIAFKEQKRLEKSLITTMERKVLAVESTNRALVREKIELQAVNKQVRQEARLKAGLVGAYERLNAKRSEAKTILANLLSAEKKNNRQIEKATRNYEILDKKVKAVDKATKDYSKNVGNYKSGLSGVNTVVKSLITSMGVLGGLALAKEVFSSYYQQAKELDTLNKSLKAVTKSEEEFAKSKARLSKIADNYGVKINGLTRSYVKFTAASKGTRLEGEKANEIFDKVTKSSAQMGLSADETGGVLKALEQIMSKGKVQAEELRGQLGDRLPGAFNIMAQSMGVTTAELDNMLKRGEVMADEVLPNFAIQLEKTFGADKTQRIDNLVSAENRFSNSWTELVDNIENGNGSIGKAVLGVLDLGTSLIKAVTPFNQVSESIKKEQIELNVLINSITESNIESGKRIVLIEELKNKYPQFLKQIKNEKYDNDSLTSSLKEVNQLYVKRIALQSQQERIEELLSKSGENSFNIAKARVKVNRIIGEVNGSILNTMDLTNKSYEEKVEIVKKALKQDAEYHKSIKTGAISALNEEAKALDRLNSALVDNFGHDKKKTRLTESLEEEQKLMKEIEVEMGATLEQINNLFSNNNDNPIKKTTKYSVTQENQKKLYDDAFALSEFYKQQEIANQNAILENENISFDKRVDALSERIEIETQLAELSRDHKLRNVKEGSDQALLIEAEYQAKLGEIISNGFDDENKIAQDLINQRQASNQKEIDEITKAYNDKVTALNNGFDAEKDSQEEHEKKLRDLKLQYNREVLEEQIKGIEKIIKASELSADVRGQFEKELSVLKRDLSAIDIDTQDKNNDSIKEGLSKIENRFNEFAGRIGNIGNTIFSNRINNIDEEIQKNEDKYSRQIELAQGDADQQEHIRKQAEIKRNELEKKKRKEQRKQAIFNKLLAVSEIGINTAVAVTKALPNLLLASAIGILGGIQAGLVVATDIPAYAKGTDNHKGGLALVGEERPEVITEPNKDPYVVSGPSILDLPQGTKVTKSLEDYQKMFANSDNQEIDLKRKRVEKAQIDKMAIMQGMKINEKAIERAIAKGFANQKVNFHTTAPKVNIDIGHEIWKHNNINWD